MPSADHKLDAIESSVVGEKGGDLAENNCECKKNLNGAGGGGVVDEGGNWVNEDANPQNYQGNGDGGSKHQKDEDTKKKFLLMETTKTVMKMMEVVKKLERKTAKKKNFQDLLLPI
jgi:hypothetical protein